MPNSVFVGREAELHKLKTFLDNATLGKAQVVFIAGEAGAGKSSLVTEFIHREEEADPKLIASMGECNAQTGIGDPYLPFRQVLTALTTGEVDPSHLDFDTIKPNIHNLDGITTHIPQFRYSDTGCSQKRKY